MSSGYIRVYIQQHAHLYLHTQNARIYIHMWTYTSQILDLFPLVHVHLHIQENRTTQNKIHRYNVHKHTQCIYTHRHMHTCGTAHNIGPLFPCRYIHTCIRAHINTSESVGRFCQLHRTFGDVDVIHQRCKKPGCTTEASFGLPGTGHPVYCKVHREHGHCVNFHKNRGIGAPRHRSNR